MSPMAGAEASLTTQGPSKRYPTKRNERKKAAAADTGPHGTSSTGRSTKRKAAKVPASGRTPRTRAAGTKSSEESETAAAAAAEGEPKNRLPQEDIDWILSQKPTAPPARYAALKRDTPELTPRPGKEADEDKMSLYRLAKCQALSEGSSNNTSTSGEDGKTS